MRTEEKRHTTTPAKKVTNSFKQTPNELDNELSMTSISRLNCTGNQNNPLQKSDFTHAVENATSGDRVEPAVMHSVNKYKHAAAHSVMLTGKAREQPKPGGA